MSNKPFYAIAIGLITIGYSLTGNIDNEWMRVIYQLTCHVTIGFCTVHFFLEGRVSR